MAFNVPTLRAIIDQIATYFEGAIDGSQPRLRGELEYILTRATADQFKDLYGFLEYLGRQLFPDSADEIYFWRWAAIWGIERKAAVAWQGVYRFTGTDTTVIPAGTQIARADGETYTTDAEATIGSVTAGLVDVAVTAENVGSDPTNADSQILELTSPIAGVDSEGAVQSTTLTGTDLETRDEGLERLLARIRTPPSGGGPGDYIRWTLENSGVTRAWEFANLEAPNSVSVAFVRDNESPIVPDAGERAAVLTYLESVAPITVGLYIITLTEQSIDLTFSALNPNTAAVLTAIEDSVNDLFVREGGPGVTIPLSRIEEAVSAAAGEISHVMTAPSADVVSTTTQVPIVGTVTGP